LTPFSGPLLGQRGLGWGEGFEFVRREVAERSVAPGWSTFWGYISCPILQPVEDVDATYEEVRAKGRRVHPHARDSQLGHALRTLQGPRWERLGDQQVVGRELMRPHLAEPPPRGSSEVAEHTARTGEPAESLCSGSASLASMVVAETGVFKRKQRRPP
jgi:hypothetical protein